MLYPQFFQVINDPLIHQLVDLHPGVFRKPVHFMDEHLTWHGASKPAVHKLQGVPQNLKAWAVIRLHTHCIHADTLMNLEHFYYSLGLNLHNSFFNSPIDTVLPLLWPSYQLELPPNLPVSLAKYCLHDNKEKAVTRLDTNVFWPASSSIQGQTFLKSV